jgi:histidyl-tRNA synthetase
LYRAVEATRDILPDEVRRWQFVEDTARDLFRRYGFSEVRTPIFEQTDLFSRSVGESTDIVSKEMYTFTDRGGRSLTLRPEGTAPAARAYVEHSVHAREEISRWYYTGPMFRYERKQKGRYRQFFQIGAEVFGSAAASVDAETLEMVMRFLDLLEIHDTKLHLSSLGCETCRGPFRQRLVEVLAPQIDTYCANCQRRFRENPLRVLDCKADAGRVHELPSPQDTLCEPCRAHFEQVQAILRDLDVPFANAPHLVRGLDYYTRTAFEVTSGGLGAQDAVLGGGRYDGLVASLGGPSVPAFGFAIGLDRLIMLLGDELAPRPADDLFILPIGEEALRHARGLASRLRRGGLRVGLPPEGKSVKALLRLADRSGARHALFLGERELQEQRLALRRLADGSESSYPMNGEAQLIQDLIHGRI